MGRMFWLVVGTILSWSKDIMYLAAVVGAWCTYSWFKTTNVIIESKGFHHALTEYIVFPMVVVVLAVAIGELLLIWVDRFRTILSRL